MDKTNGFVITDRDKVLRAWLNSTELVRDYQDYAKEMDDKKLSELFSDYAETEAHQAAHLLSVLKGLDK